MAERGGDRMREKGRGGRGCGVLTIWDRMLAEGCGNIFEIANFLKLLAVIDHSAISLVIAKSMAT